MEEEVRRLYESFGRGDVEALLALVTEDVEWRSPPSGVPGLEDAYRGKTALRRWFRDIRDGWETMAVEPERIDAVARDVALVTVRMHGRASGLDTEMPLWHVIEFRGGRVAFLAPFFERDAALALAQERNTERPG